MKRNLPIPKGLDWSEEFQIALDGSPVDLTGCTFQGHARRDETPTAPLAFSFSFAYNAVTRFVTVSVAGSATASLEVGPKPDDRQSQFYYDFIMTWPGGDKDVIQEGKVTLLRTITR
jgi:hypothetical protein